MWSRWNRLISQFEFGNKKGKNKNDSFFGYLFFYFFKNSSFGCDLKLDAKDLQKKMEEWKLSEWHKFFKQNTKICKKWPEWKKIALRSPESFLEDIDWFGNENRLLYNEIRTVFYFCCFKFANKKYIIIIFANWFFFFFATVSIDCWGRRRVLFASI